MAKTKKLTIKETVKTPTDKLTQNPGMGLNPNGNGKWQSQPEELNNNPNHRMTRLNEKPLDPSFWQMPGQTELEKALTGKK
jgi:hypothetical protein